MVNNERQEAKSQFFLNIFSVGQFHEKKRKVSVGKKHWRLQSQLYTSNISCVVVHQTMIEIFLANFSTTLIILIEIATTSTWSLAFKLLLE